MSSTAPPSGSHEQAPGRSDVLRFVAPNPGPMTLAGTNSYIVARAPAYVIDPGPAEEEHLARIRAAARELGGIGGVLLTHSHSDHTASAGMLDAPVLWGHVGQGDETHLPVAHEAAAVAPGARPAVGPFTVIATPGHAADHVVFAYDDVVFCGDMVLGEGSSIVPPAAWGGSLADYMRSLDAVDALGARLLCPGHGPWIEAPRERIGEYREHRLERERRLLAALDAGDRSRAALLTAAWGDVPEPMRPMAAIAMQAHLEKLEAEGRLPSDVGD